MAKFRVTMTGMKLGDVLRKSITESDLRREGERLSVEIENRTLAGTDENGRRFAPYARGRTKYGSATPDLHDTGRMFSDFGVTKASRRGFTLGFRSRRSEQIAGFHQDGTARMPARPFLGVPETWITAMVRRIKARIR